jgi:hypothetical protein
MWEGEEKHEKGGFFGSYRIDEEMFSQRIHVSSEEDEK